MKWYGQDETFSRRCKTKKRMQNSSCQRRIGPMVSSKPSKTMTSKLSLSINVISGRAIIAYGKLTSLKQIMEAQSVKIWAIDLMPSSQWFEMKTTHFQHSFLLFYKFSLWWCGTIQKGESTCLKQILIKHRKEKACVHYPTQRIPKQIKQRLVHSIYKRKRRIKTKDSTVLVKGSQESEPDGKGRSTERKREHWKLWEWCLFALL